MPAVKHRSLENRSTKGNVPRGMEQLGKTKTCGGLLKKNLEIIPTMAARTNTQLRASAPHMGIGWGAVTAHKPQHMSWDNSAPRSITIIYQIHFTVHAICWLGCLCGQLGNSKHSNSTTQMTLGFQSCREHGGAWVVSDLTSWTPPPCCSRPRWELTSRRLWLTGRN